MKVVIGGHYVVDGWDPQHKPSEEEMLDDTVTLLLTHIAGAILPTKIPAVHVILLSIHDNPLQFLIQSILASSEASSISSRRRPHRVSTTTHAALCDPSNSLSLTLSV